MKKSIVFLLTLGALMGCSLIEKATSEIVPPVVRVVESYCDELDEHARFKFRSEINDKLNGHSILIECEGDSRKL